MKPHLRILVVDDKEENSYYLRALLSGHGCDVTCARHGAEALILARQSPPDIVVTDLLMPVMDGYTLLRLWRADPGLNQIPFIVYTATYTEPEDERLALNLGADAFILKPSEPDHFIARIDEVLDAASSGNGTARLPHSADANDELLLVYNQTLVRKLEARTFQLEQANIALKADIAAREKAEAELRLLNSAVLQIQDAVTITDAELDFPGPRIVFVNSAFTRMTGYTAAEVLGKTPRIMQGPRSDRALLAELRRKLSAGETFEGEAINYRKDGSEYIQNWRITPLRNDEDVVTHFIATQRDVTERRRAGNELRRKTAFLEAQVNSSLDGILVVDSQGHKVLQNQQMVDLWNIPPDVSASNSDPEQIAWAAKQTTDPTRFIQQVTELYNDPKAVLRDEVHLKNGIVLDRFSAPVKDEDGTYYGRIWTFRDVTEERTRETKLTEALARETELAEEARAGDRAKSEFLAVMSHEIRTPLNGILGFAEMLTQTNNPAEETREYASIIASSGEALLHILDDILDFSRLEAGRLQIESICFDPQGILENIRVLLAAQAAFKGLEFRVDLQAGVPPFLRGDPGRVRQILLNLVGNSIKFTETGSVIIGVRPGHDDGFCEFFVKDTGPGIAQDQIDRIFRPFTQVDSTISRRFGGTGLGLAISRRLAELMNGTLTAISESGDGAELILRLPMAASEDDRPPPPDVTTIDLSPEFAARYPLNILVVEDDKVNLKLILALIRRLGYEPLAARNGREAVDIHRREHPTCILMDLQMPEMDGIEATAQIRALERSHPNHHPAYITALTANIVPADRQRCFDAGMNNYLNKPIQLPAIAAALIAARNQCVTN